ncbi:hypothetical protein ACJX0J_011281, partial [Zea mays]
LTNNSRETSKQPQTRSQLIPRNSHVHHVENNDRDRFWIILYVSIEKKAPKCVPKINQKFDGFFSYIFKKYRILVTFKKKHELYISMNLILHRDIYEHLVCFFFRWKPMGSRYSPVSFF